MEEFHSIVNDDDLDGSIPQRNSSRSSSRAPSSPQYMETEPADSENPPQLNPVEGTDHPMLDDTRVYADPDLPIPPLSIVPYSRTSD